MCFNKNKHERIHLEDQSCTFQSTKGKQAWLLY